MNCWLLLLVLVACAGAFDELKCILDGKCLDDLPDRIIAALTNTHLVLLGDSLTRYQYLSMAYAIRHRKVVSPVMWPNFVEEKTYASWQEFFEITNSLLKPMEVCDCQRYKEGDVTTWYENRYFFDPQYNITISFFFLTGSVVQGHLSPNEQRNPDLVSGFPKVILSAPTWIYDTATNIDEFFSKFLPQLTPKPDAVVFNYGKWHVIVPDAMITGIVFGAVNLVDVFIWKTTTVNFAENEQGFAYHREVDAKFTAFDVVTIMNTSWTGGVNFTHRVDNDHFREPVYSILNVQLLDVLADAKSKVALRKLD